MTHEDVQNEMENNERAARTGFAQKRVVWYGHGRKVGEWKEDWLFYVQNEHTLLSIWCGHALHPFDRFDRVMYFLCVASFSLFMSAYVNAAHPHSKGLVEYGGWLVLSSILLVFYDYLLKFLATSPCMQPGGSCYDNCWVCCRECCVDCGKQGLYLCAAGSAGFLTAGVVIAVTSSNVQPGMFFATFVLMRGLSYCGEFMPHAYYFYTKRDKQRQYWRDGVAGGPYPFGPGLPDEMYIAESRRDGYVVKWQTHIRHNAGGGRSQSGGGGSPNGAGGFRRSGSSSSEASPSSLQNPLWGSSSSSSDDHLRSPVSVQRQRERSQRDKQLEMLRRQRDQKGIVERAAERNRALGRESKFSLAAQYSDDDALDTLGSRV